MARDSVAKARRNIMAQEKVARHLEKAGLHGSITQSQSLLNVAELETRAKATVKDLNELYAALQGLVPKTGQTTPSKHKKGRATASATGTDTDTAKSSDDWDRPRLVRKYHSEKFPKKPWRDDNMNYIAEPKEKPQAEKPALKKTLSDERLFASDTEAELKNAAAKQQQHRMQRHSSLPTAYEGDSANETMDRADTIHKKSKFSIFHRHHHHSSKASKKKASGWRSFFSTLSLKRRRSKKHGKNKIADGLSAQNQEKVRTPKRQAKKNHSAPLQERTTPKYKAKKNLSVPLDVRTPKPTPRLSFDLVDTSGQNYELRKSQKKRIAPEPPSLTPVQVSNDDIPHERRDTMETKSDEVQKKLSAWYKYAVKETHSLEPKETIRAVRSCENLLTDTEIIRKRGTFSSDTDSTSFSSGDRAKSNVSKVRVRKTRAKRNRRRRERGARFHSLPNVKLVTKALDAAEQKTCNPSKVPADDVTNAKHVTTIKPVEAQLSFGSTLEAEQSIKDFVKLHQDARTHGQNWMTRQASRTTISCIRPLQLSLFYSESPSRETVHRSRSTIRRPRATGDGKESGDNSHEFAFKIRRSSSRRRKRRSFKRQTRLPHQSPFYVPPNNLNIAPNKDTDKEDCTSISKDSGLGSPDASQDIRFATFPDVKRRLSKLHSESEDSGWASSYRHLPNKADTGIQTDPVIVMTAVSTVRRPVLPHVIQDDNSQSEA